tara:strand:- start:746 stop:1330 length:585 start_codon:yes stop_codon:yes gene_type:complete
MSQLKLTADSGGGTVALKGPSSTASNAAIELTLPGTSNATLLTSASTTGKVLQFDSVKWGTYTSTTSTSYIDTGLTINITPVSATSTIAIVGRIQLTKTSYTAIARLLRDSTEIGSNPDTGTNSDLFTFYSQNSYMSIGIPFMHDDDGHDTTSQITYKLQIKSDGGNTLYMNGHNNNTGSYHSMSYMSVMEIAA